MQISEIPISGSDAVVVVKALRNYAFICERMSHDDTLPEKKRVDLLNEAQVAARVQSAFTHEPSFGPKDSRDN